MVDQAIPEVADLTKYIETHLFGERPHICGRRIAIATIAYNFHTHGWSVSETAHNFGLSGAEVLGALLYYEEHRAAIDAQEIAYQAELDDAYRQHGRKV